VDELEARRVLESFGIAERLEHIRRFVWREGSLRLVCEARQVFYELAVEWDTVALSVIETELQQWQRATAGYVLRVGIDLASPLGIAVQSEQLRSLIPFRDRPAEQVEHALHADLAAYVNVFLNTCMPIDSARAAGLARLRALGL
jgi:hypothetical protein